MDKLLTISVAAYNIEKTIRRTLESCVIDDNDKLFQQIEVLIISDGSTDNTIKIAKEFQDRYPDVFRVHVKENGGYGSTINTALKYSIGKYFKLLDGDDTYCGESLKKIVYKLQNCDSDIILTDYNEVNELSGKIHLVKASENLEEATYHLEKVIATLCLSMHSICYKTELLKVNDIRITEKCFYTDIEFLLKPIIHAKTVTYFKNSLYQYRVGIEGQSVSKEGMRKHYEDAYIVLKEISRTLTENPMSNSMKIFLQNQITMTAKFTLRSFLLLKPSRKNKEKIIKIDKWIKQEIPEVYYNMENRTIKSLRRSGYSIYPICSQYLSVKYK